jgi:hypothetical protein
MSWKRARHHELTVDAITAAGNCTPFLHANTRTVTPETRRENETSLFLYEDFE